MGICIEPFEHFFGLRQKFEQWVFRTQPEGKRSGPGDLDLTIYSLAKWCRLALAGNSTVLNLLFLPDNLIVYEDDRGRALRMMRDLFVSSNLFGPYLGYMRQQRSRLVRRVKMLNRPELIETYGFDTKYAGHLIRLGYQGVELALTGKLELPMEEPIREYILNVRTGKIPEHQVLEYAQMLEDQLVVLKETSDLGPPKTEEVEAWVIKQYLRQA